MKRLLLLFSVLLAAGARAGGPDYEAEIEALLARMTLAEKIGQMNQQHPDNPDLRAEIRAGRVGSVLSVVGARETNELQRIAVEQTRLGIPLINGRDVIHGFRTIFPIPLGQAASFDPELVEACARIAAREARAAGIHWTFAPMVDISHDPRWGRIAESCGEDPLLAERMGAAMVRGFQTSDLADPTAVAACVKHFAGYGAAEGGRDYNSTYIPERLFRNLYLRPFRAAVGAGAATLMTSFNANDGVPSSGSRFLLGEVLRDEWRFDGFVVSDWASVAEMVPHGFCADEKEAASRAVSAGLDMEMVSSTYVAHLEALVAEGAVSMAAIDDAVRNILRIKFRLGLFDNPYAPLDGEPAYAPDALRMARTAAAESAVLLKNDGRCLPLGSGIRTIAVTGPLADAPHDQLGTWVFDGEADRTQTPAAALRGRTGIRTIEDPLLACSRSELPADAAERVARLAEADVILFFAGEEAILSGEAHCLSTLSLQGGQERLAELLAATGKPVVTVVMAGRPLDIRPLLRHSAAVLYAFHPGTMGGPALADLLFGDAVPSGKLPVTFPVSVGQIPIYYNHNATGRPARGDEMLLPDIPLRASQTSLGNTSYYLDIGTKPLFPFGFGLSYTSFSYGEVRLSAGTIPIDGSVTVSATLTNTGDREATEVVQCYLCDVAASAARPVRELAGFRRVTLAPGECREVTFTLGPEELSFWNVDLRETVEPGEFRVGIGGDSTVPLEGRFFVIP